MASSRALLIISSMDGAGWPVIAGVITPRCTAPTAGPVTPPASNRFPTRLLSGLAANSGAVAAVRSPLAAADLYA